MTAEIERVLKEKCSLDPRLELLQAQWAYDRRLVSQALQTVGSTFPHYSQHDASHSSTILVQITRVLGARISQLSATDLWLLLESAYWHDIGMVVDDNTLRKWWDSSEFRSHIDTLVESSDDVLASAARLLKDRKLRCDSHDLDIKHAITMVAADYARGLHADRSGELVDRPLMIGLQTPRTLIPQRLFYWLGQIAMAHGRSHAFVNSLPYSEEGMGTDDCHPRFVARMLRLGDLLDLDNGRFCPVLLSMVGRIPASSLAHIGKHASVRHFCVGPDKIEVTAVCESAKTTEPHTSPPAEETNALDPYASYEAIATWLGWLEKELGYLASHWADIAPPNFGGAPSIGTIEARLNDYICLKEGERPRFRVDETAFLALIRSNTLYQDQHAWLRELLANAEDATRIRAFVEHKARLLSLNDRSVQDPIRALTDALNNYPITVAIQNVKERGNQVFVSISDHGTGISLKDLEYILTIGSSRKNPARKRIVSEMPDLLKPTGAFGIGLQSVFMVTDEIVIDTLHFRSRDRLSITIRRKAADGSLATTITKGRAAAAPKATRDIPTGVYVRQIPEGQGLSEPGTCIQFFIKQESAMQSSGGVANSVAHSDIDQVHNMSLDIASEPSPKSSRASGLSLKSQHIEPIDAASRFDPILTEEGGLEAEVLKNVVEDIAHRLAAPIILNDVPLRNDLFSEDGFLFSHEEQCAILFRSTNLSDNRVSLRYRGAEVRNHNLGDIGLLDVVVDLHFGGAAEILTASRDSLTPFGNAFVQEKVNNALADVFPTYLKQLGRRTTRNRRSIKTSSSRPSDEAAASFANASLFAKVYLPKLPGMALSRKWEDVPIALKRGELVSLSRLLSAETFDISVPMSSGLQVGAVHRSGRHRDVPQFTLLPDYPNCVRDILLNLEKNSQMVDWGQEGVMRYRFGASEVNSIESRDFERMLAFWPSWNRHKPGYFRPTFPAPPEFSQLALDFNQLPKWALQDRLLVRNQFVSPIEFCFDSKSGDVIFNTAHLPFYVDWICRTPSLVDGSQEDKRRQSVIDAVRGFFKLLPNIGRRLHWQDGNREPKDFAVGMIDSILSAIS